MDNLICPSCQDMPMYKTESGRECPNCGHVMNEIDYQMYVAQRMAYVTNISNTVSRDSRKSFGRKRVVSKATS